MEYISVLIDESGTLPDPSDKVVIVAAVGINTPTRILSINRMVRKNLKKPLGEIKFYKAGEKTKTKFLKALAKEDLKIFTLIVEKQGKKITDSPENFALLCWLILEECLLFYKNKIKEVIFDKHFHQEKDQKLFNYFLFQFLKKKIKLVHVNSQEDQRISAPDMIAGSLLWAKTKNDSRFYKIIKNQIISEKMVNWRQIKSRFWNKKMPEPVQAPIQTNLNK